MSPRTSKPPARHPSPPDLQGVAHEASPFQRREWVWQRVGWISLGLFLLAGAAGVFGGGPLAHRSVASPAANLEYERFVRKHANTRWELTLKGGEMGGSIDVAIDSAFASQFEIMRIHPEPVSAELRGGRWVYRFDVAADADDSLLVFHVQPRRMGRHAGMISVDGAPPITLSQLAYP